jgi:pimeloyl-ACP methyl ester carboxylesterase
LKILYKTLTALGAATAGAAVANSVISNRIRSIENVIGGHERIYRWRFGDIFYTMDGQGEPLLFIHGIGAGVSSYEWRKNFEPLSDQFTVYALDLLGFGLSDKPSINYTAGLYIQLIIDFIMNVIGRPVDVAASSHGGAYAILIAEKHRPIIKRLLLSCPTGIGVADSKTQAAPGLSTTLRIPVFGKSAYYMITSRKSIENYLTSQVYADPTSVTLDIIDHYYASSHQPGSERAIRALTSGALNVNVYQQFSELAQPVALAWGQQARITPVDIADRFLEANSLARLQVFDNAAQLPHEEDPDSYNALARDVFSRPPEGVTVPPHKHLMT